MEQITFCSNKHWRRRHCLQEEHCGWWAFHISWFHRSTTNTNLRGQEVTGQKNITFHELRIVTFQARRMRSLIQKAIKFRRKTIFHNGNDRNWNDWNMTALYDTIWLFVKIEQLLTGKEELRKCIWNTSRGPRAVGGAKLAKFERSKAGYTRIGLVTIISLENTDMSRTFDDKVIQEKNRTSLCSLKNLNWRQTIRAWSRC